MNVGWLPIFFLLRCVPHDCLISFLLAYVQINIFSPVTYSPPSTRIPIGNRYVLQGLQVSPYRAKQWVLHRVVCICLNWGWLSNIVVSSTRTSAFQRLAGSYKMGEKLAFFHDKWCATRLRCEPSTAHCSFTIGFTTIGTKIGNVGFHLGGTFGNLVDLCFADDMLLFAGSGPELVQFVFQIDS